MPEFLETTVDKFTFKVATDRLYHPAGVWVLAEAGRVRIGLTDFLQQRSGDIAFVDVKPAGTRLIVEQEAASIETIKVDVSLPSPVEGTVTRVNPDIEAAPEKINQDPYGEGWLCEIEADHWEADRAALLDPPAYFAQMQREAEEETKKS
ncbi:MAG TPA: glycine cleavage system protein H [Anaerolineaceae bacterium]